LLDDQWVIDEIKEEIKRYLKVNDNENTRWQDTKSTYRNH
jgi:hypothetical protein